MTTPLVPEPPLSEHAWDPAWDNDPDIMPNYDNLVVEDGKPVDSIYVEKQYKLLTEPLYASWRGPNGDGQFLALSNVGWFISDRSPPMAPDAMLIVGVGPAAPPREKEGRSFFQWRYTKTPDVVIEIVSDRRGDEESLKMTRYAERGASYYVIYDPDDWLKNGVLRGFELRGKRYRPTEVGWIEDVGLGLLLWQGRYAGVEETWLRWCDKDGKVIPNGEEQADRARKLAEQLRKLGVEPEA